MGFQRAPRLKPASITDNHAEMKQYEFFKSCAEVLGREGKDEASFYFEQLVDHLQRGGKIYGANASKVLGL